MSEQTVAVRGTILEWARKQAGYSIEEVAAALNKDPAIIASWENENSDSAPTYVQLEKLAYSLYKRPLAIFFLPQPPDEPALKNSFRTLPDFEIESLEPDTRYALRYARALQLSLAELNEGVNPSEKKIFTDIHFRRTSNVPAVARQVRQYLGVPLDQQIALQNSEEALKFWRDKVEQVGIFVFKRSFKQKDISGFCLLDEQFPLIYLNNSAAKSRQIFTVFHELAHILSHINGITKANDSYINALPKPEREIEQLCNAFAGEFLVPSGDFERRIKSIRVDDESVSTLANVYKVSREVILRKLLDKGLVDKQYYEEKAAEWIKEYLESQSESGGGNYYQTQAAYLSKTYMDLVFGKYYSGQLSVQEVADHLGIKASSVPGLEHVFSRSGS